METLEGLWSALHHILKELLGYGYATLHQSPPFSMLLYVHAWQLCHFFLGFTIAMLYNPFPTHLCTINQQKEVASMALWRRIEEGQRSLHLHQNTSSYMLVIGVYINLVPYTWSYINMMALPQAYQCLGLWLGYLRISATYFHGQILYDAGFYGYTLHLSMLSKSCLILDRFCIALIFTTKAPLLCYKIPILCTLYVPLLPLYVGYAHDGLKLQENS